MGNYREEQGQIKPTVRNLRAPSPRLKASPADVSAALKLSTQVRLCTDLDRMEGEARHAGLYITARALNNAKNAAGWETAGNLIVAGAAARGERTHESRGR